MDDFLIQKAADKLVLTLQFSDLETTNAAKLKSELINIISEGNMDIILDLKNINFMDSSGLGSLVACLKNAQSNGGSLALCNIGVNVHSLLELTRLIKVFKIFSNVNEALDSIEQK